MPRSAGQSDFVIRRDDPVELPEGAGAVELPTARLRSDQASERATRWMLRLTFLILGLLALLLAVGPHLPSGE